MEHGGFGRDTLADEPIQNLSAEQGSVNAISIVFPGQGAPGLVVVGIQGNTVPVVRLLRALAGPLGPPHATRGAARGDGIADALNDASSLRRVEDWPARVG